MNAKAPAAAPPVPCNAHDRSTGADYEGLCLCGVPSVGHFLTLRLPNGKRAHFRIEDVQHVARVGTGAASLQLYLRKALEPIRTAAN